MLHLEPRVHLHEIDLLGLEVEDELHRASANVADVVGKMSRVLEGGGAKVVREQGRARLFDDLLLIALHTAVSQTQYTRVSVTVAEHLDLNVAEPLDELLEVEVATPEGATGLGPHPKEGVLQLLRLSHDLDPTAPAAVHRLEHDGIPDFFGDSERSSRTRDNTVTTRDDGDPEAPCRLHCVGLVADALHTRLVRSDEVETVLRAQSCEGRAL